MSSSDATRKRSSRRKPDEDNEYLWVKRKSSKNETNASGFCHTWAKARSLAQPKHFICVCLRELIAFTLFLIFLSWVVLETNNFYRNVQCKIIMDPLTKTLYKTNLSSINSTAKIYYSIENIPDLWSFVSNHFLTVMYVYNQQLQLLELQNESSTMFLFSNLLVGTPRIRLLRVRNDSCKIPEMFQGWYKNCYYYFSPQYEDKNPFGNGTNEAWTYRKTKDIQSYSGKISVYTPNGYYIDLPVTYAEAKKIIDEFYQLRWIDRGTRAIFIDFTTYTPDSNLFTVVKLLMELPPGGGVFPTADCYSLRLMSYSKTWQYIILAIIVLFGLYFLLTIGKDIVYLGWSYLISWWGILDISILFLMLGALVTAVMRQMFINSELPSIIKNIGKVRYVSLDMHMTLDIVLNMFLGILIISCWLKYLKFFAMFTRVGMMLVAVGKCKKQLCTLFFMGFIILLGFSLCGHIIFGSHVEEFTTIGKSMFSLITIPVGGLYFYNTMDQARPILAPLFILAFIFLFVFILMLLFIAVLVNSTEKAEEIFALSGPYGRFGPREYLLNLAIHSCTRCNCTKLARYLRKRLKMIVLRMRHSLLLALLRKYGIHGLEIELFLARHGIRYGYDVNSEQLSRITADLKTKQYLLYKETVEHETLYEQIEGLQKRIELIDEELYSTSTKFASYYKTK